MFEFLARVATLARVRLLPKEKENHKAVPLGEPAPYEGPSDELYKRNLGTNENLTE